MERGWTLLALGTLCLSAFMHTCTATTTTAISSTATAGVAANAPGGNTGPGGCTDSFMLTANSGRQGGEIQPNFYTEPQCRALCLSRTRVNCAGYDFAAASNAPAGQRACWIHTSAVVAANEIRSRPGETIDTYTRMACDAATTTPTSTPASGCIDTFTVSTNTNFNGGIRTPAAGNSAALCEAYCLGQATCTGFDIELNNGVCWIFTQATFTTGGNPQNVNHHRRVPCNATTGSTSCVDGFTEERAMQLFNGSPRAGVDPVGCRSVCLSETFCSHYETNAASQCFLHFNQTGQTPTRITDQNHRLFTRVPCQTSTISGVCRDNFTPRPNTNVFGGTVQRGVTTLEACQGVCLSITNPPCTAFDFAPFGGERCFTFTSVNRQYQASNDVTHYERNFRCNGTVTGPTCVESYSSTANSNRQGGVRQASITTDAECARQCSLTAQGSSNTCFGYDFNSISNECYFHVGSIPTQTGSFTGVTSYVRLFVCDRTSTVGTGCRDVYTASANSNVFGGTAQTSSNTESLCRAACSATIEGQTGYCYGYDFDSNSNQCFFILTATYVISPGANGVTHYNRRRDCPGSATPSGCVEAYNATQNRNAQGGTDVGAQTVESCQRECNNRTSCFGFDFANGNCWVHLAEYTLNPGAANGVTNYRRQFNCGGTTTGSGCVPTYTQRANIIVYGGVAAPAGSDTVATCAVACNSDTNCVAYNFDKVSTSGKCYLLRGSVGTENPNNDLDLYVQDNNCDGQTTPGGTQCRMDRLGVGNVEGGTFVPNTNTLQQCLDWCIQNDACMAVDWDLLASQCFWFTTMATTTSGSSCCEHYNKVCENRCVDTFNVTAGTGYFGGVEVTNRPTVAQCQGACIESEPCAGFDFNTETGQCFTLLLSNLDRSYSFSGVTHYRRVRCATGGTPGRTTLPTTIRTTACPDRYTPIPNSNAQGGVRDNNANTLAACQRGCSDDVTCTAIDYDGSGCWRHTGNPQVRRNQAPGVTHYQKRPCQDTPAPPVTFTPSPLVCNLDIFFLVDAIDSTLLQEMILVIQQVSNGLNVGALGQGARVGVRSFGNTQQRLFQYADSRGFIEVSVSNIQRLNGPNNLPAALQAFLTGDPTDQFPVGEYQSSRQQNRELLLVIMSDLNVNQVYLNQLSSQRSQLQTIPTVVVTFNNQINNNLIQNFGSPSQVRHRPGFSVTTANDIINRVANPRCRSNANLTPRPVVTIAPPTIVPRQCQGDVAFLVDDSGSIREGVSRGGRDNWPDVLNFVREVIARLVIGPANVRISVATFSNNATLVYRFSQPQNTVGLNQVLQINTFPYTGGNTNLMAGLRLLSDQVFQGFNGDRPQEPNVVILITDGRPTGANDALLQQEIARARGIVQIIPVGVTDNVDTNVLRLLAGNQQVFNVANFEALSTIIGGVVDASCRALRR